MKLRDLLEIAKGNLDAEVRNYVVISEQGTRTTKAVIHAEFRADHYGPVLYLDTWNQYDVANWQKGNN